VKGLFSLLLGAALLFPAPATADPRADARRYFVEGLQAAEAERYEAALEAFQRAYDIHPHPSVLYNIGRAHLDLGRTEEALRYFQMFRIAAPEQASLVDPTVASLEAELTWAAEQAAAEAAAEEAAKARAQAAVAELDEVQAVSEPPERETLAPEEVAALLADAYERVIVTSSRHGQSPLESPSTISVLSRHEIASSGATNIPDLLRRVVGVDVMALSGAQPDVSIRGFNQEMSNKVLVLVDGRTVYQDMWGTVLWSALPIGLADIERIEVTRGPGAAIYGANAFTGVVNIITRRPGEGIREIQVEAGLPGATRDTVFASGREGRLAWRASAGVQREGRWSRESEVSETEALLLYADDQDLAQEVVRANGQLDGTFGDEGRLSASAGISQGVTHFYPWGSLGRYALPFRSTYARTDASWRGLNARVFVNQLSGDGPYPTFDDERALETSLDSRVADGELVYDRSFDTGGLHHRLQVGADYRFKQVDWGYLVEDRIREHHLSAFIQDELWFGPLQVLAGARLDRHPLVALSRTLSPRLAAVLRIGEATAVRASAGSAFRTPTYMESYLDFEQSTGVDALFVNTLGDTDLLPERVWTAEVGLHDESTPFHAFDAALYASRLTDRISMTDLQPAVHAFDEEQAGFSIGTTGFANEPRPSNAIGTELEVHAYPLDGLDLFGNLALQRTWGPNGKVDQSTSAAKVNAGVTHATSYRSDVSAFVHVLSRQVWELPAFDADGSLVTYKESVDPRVILSARVATRPLADESLEIAFTGWNLLAPVLGPIQEHPKGQWIGVRVHGTLTYSF